MTKDEYSAYGFGFGFIRKKKRRLPKKKKRHVCRPVQGGADVHCADCGRVFYA